MSRVQLTAGVFLAAFMLIGPVHHAVAQAKPEKPAASNVVVKFPLGTQPPKFGIVREISAEGWAKITPPNDVPALPPEFQPPTVEGYYLAVVQKSFQSQLKGARVFRVQVTDVGEKGALMLQFSKTAVVKVQTGEFVMLFRPGGSTTEQMKQLPEFAELEEGSAAGQSAEIARLMQSFNNLKQIGLALHNYHDTYKRFPPAVVNGPDGKPWHSWRVLILPFLDEANLYNAYKWDEPWNGTNNKKLLEKMPKTFGDPIHGENKEFYTHYVAITGDGMSFPTEGAVFDGKDIGSLDRNAGKRIADFIDGTSNSLIIGPVGPESKIPWMKPEDIKITDKFPALGKKGSFTVPYKTEKGSVGPFLRCDGSVVGIADSVDMEVFRAFVTISGAEVVNWETVPSFNPPRMERKVPVIYVEKTAKGTTVKLVEEAMEVPRFGPGPGAVPGAAAPPPRALPAPAPAERKVPTKAAKPE